MLEVEKTVFSLGQTESRKKIDPEKKDPITSLVRSVCTTQHGLRNRIDKLIRQISKIHVHRTNS